MTDRFFFELDPERAMLRAVDGLIDHISRPRDLMEILAAVLESNVQQRFDDKVDPTGASWAQLAPATVAMYREKYGETIPGSLLERSRQMRQSLTANAGDDWAEIGMSRKTPPNKSGKVWDLPVLHEHGTKRMPRRGLLTADPEAGRLGDADLRDIEDEFAAWLAQPLG